MRLLIVEDNVRLATLMAKLVGNHGLTADIAGSIDEARAALGFVDYDVVLRIFPCPTATGKISLQQLDRTSVMPMCWS